MITLLVLLACFNYDSNKNDAVATTSTSHVTITSADFAGFSPLPSNFFKDGVEPKKELISLGERLFNDPVLSADKDISCSSCHNLETGGVDNKQFSDGHKGAKTGRNTPTVFNSAGHVAQFWDGRASDVEAQALGPILAAGEMGMPNEQAVVSALSANPEYVAAFKSAFPEQKDPLTFQNVGFAIGAYERTLVTPSRWDDFLAGDNSALSDVEKQGFKDFTSMGCSGCHAGTLIGGQIFMKLGVVNPWPNQKDLGKYNLTSNESDKMIFKVPSLRNSALTAPYFHDGSVETLPEAVKLMAYHQLGATISDDKAASISAWLASTSKK